jgi:hypothetical protein
MAEAIAVIDASNGYCPATPMARWPSLVGQGKQPPAAKSISTSSRCVCGSKSLPLTA